MTILKRQMTSIFHFLIFSAFTVRWLKSSVLDSFPKFHFLVEPQNVIAQGHRASVVLDCLVLAEFQPRGQVSRPPIINIRWKEDGKFLQFNDIQNPSRRILSNGSLLISLASMSSSRKFRSNVLSRFQCIVSVVGIGVLLSRTAILQIIDQPPSFKTEPRDLTVFLGDTTSFDCSVYEANQTFFSRTWMKNDRPLILDHRMTIFPSGRLEISQVRLADSADYLCIISENSTTRKKSSRSATLRINLDKDEAAIVKIPSFVSTPKDAFVSNGSTVTFECVANGNPTPQITWLKDGSTIDMTHLDSRFTRLGYATLQIQNVGLQDRGTYQCRAQNSMDSVDSTAVLDVHVSPTIVHGPSDGVFFEKHDAELSCDVHAVPKATVVWYKNGEVIVYNEYFQMLHGNTLKILGLISQDSGIYQCFASNGVGSVHASAQLKVIKEIKSKNPPYTNGNMFEKTPLPPTNVVAAVIGTRFITLNWKSNKMTDMSASSGIANLKDFQDLNNILGFSVFCRQKQSIRERVLNSSLEEINIQGLIPGNDYVIRVVAWNVYGPGISSPPFTIRTRSELKVPGPVRFLRARPTSATSVLVTWERPVYYGELITKYKLYFRKALESITLREFVIRGNLDKTLLQHHVTQLNEFTEYSFWVSAFNANGEGVFHEEVEARTFSSFPDEPPTNVFVEPKSSTSLLLRWDPPPKHGQNGIITGYRIRWRRRGGGGGLSRVITTDGNRRLFEITGLRKEKEYQVKISAQTVNGTGPSTLWLSSITFESDLDESVVPDQPNYIRAVAFHDSIRVSWAPPLVNSKVLVRGYRIGWGKGIPDVFSQVIGIKPQVFTIEHLEANQEYVISIRAFNNEGDGRPNYETVRTLDQKSSKEHFSPSSKISSDLVVPVGLRTTVLSATSIVLTWIDSSLPQNQFIPDQRYYVIRYTNPRGQHRYRNSSDLNCLIDDLLPFTKYEFAVKVVRDTRQSPWSLVVLNITDEAPPKSSPRNLLVLSRGPRAVRIEWNPPSIPNGIINGYVIQYSSDQFADERDWLVEAVIEDDNFAIIDSLKPKTLYYFKIRARNRKGYGPFSVTADFTTIGDQSSSAVTSPAQFSPVLLYAIVGMGSAILVVLLLAISLTLRCKCKGLYRPNRPLINGSKRYVRGQGNEESMSLRQKLNPPPPDLWIGHDQLELKNVQEADVTDCDLTGDTSVARSSPSEFRSASSMAAPENNRTHFSSDQSYVSSYQPSVHCQKLRTSSGLLQCKSACSEGQNLLAGSKTAAINGKPRIHSRYLSRDSIASSCNNGYPSLSNRNCGSASDSSTYIRSQYTLNPPPSTASPDELPPPGYDPSLMSEPSTIDESSVWIAPEVSSGSAGLVACQPPQLPPTYLSSGVSTSSGESASSSGGSRRQCSLNLKSFTAAVPPSVRTNSLQPKSLIVYPQQQKCSSLLRHPQSGLGGCCQFPVCSTSGHSFISPMPDPDVFLHSSDEDSNKKSCFIKPMQASFSTEELNAELKHLEGLMKDLNCAKPDQNVIV